MVCTLKVPMVKFALSFFIRCAVSGQGTHVPEPHGRACW